MKTVYLWITNEGGKVIGEARYDGGEIQCEGLLGFTLTESQKILNLIKDDIEKSVSRDAWKMLQDEEVPICGSVDCPQGILNWKFTLHD